MSQKLRKIDRYKNWKKWKNDEKMVKNGARNRQKETKNRQRLIEKNRQKIYIAKS